MHSSGKLPDLWGAERTFGLGLRSLGTDQLLRLSPAVTFSAIDARGIGVGKVELAYDISNFSRGSSSSLGSPGIEMAERINAIALRRQETRMGGGEKDRHLGTLTARITLPSFLESQE